MTEGHVAVICGSFPARRYAACVCHPSLMRLTFRRHATWQPYSALAKSSGS